MRDLAQPWPLTLDRRGWLLAGLGYLIVLAIVYPVDVPIALWAQDLPEPTPTVFRWITRFGESDWILIPALALWLGCALAAALFRRPVARRALAQLSGIFAFIFIGVGLPGLVTTIIKRVIGRARPELLDHPDAGAFAINLLDHTHQSFPSGHATTSFALCFVLAFLVPRSLPWALIFAGLIGFSRLVVGAHYATDVLAGLAIGTLGAYAVRNAFAARGRVFRRTPEGQIERRPPAALRRLLARRGPVTAAGDSGARRP